MISTQENGIASNVARPASLNISSSTNANPIAVTTGSNHGLTTGDTVYIAGHATNTGANGVNVVTVTGLATFTIAVAGIGIGGATGTVQPLGFNATFPIPADGVDNDDSATYNAAFQPLADRTAWLAARVGSLYLLSQTMAPGNNDDSGGIWSHNASVPASWANIASTPTVDLWGVIGAADIIEVDFQTDSATSGAALNSLAIGWSGAKVLNTGRRVAANSFAGLRASFLAPSSGNKRVSVMCEDTGGSATTLDLIGDWTMTVRLWRAP